MTGVRFLKKGRIIHLIVSERKIGPFGKIEKNDDSNDTTWVGDFSYVKQDTNVAEGYDYHNLTWSSRGIDLDIIRAPQGEVVTGVRFRLVNNRIQLQIRKWIISKMY